MISCIIFLYFTYQTLFCISFNIFTTPENESIEKWQKQKQIKNMEKKQHGKFEKEAKNSKEIISIFFFFIHHAQVCSTFFDYKSVVN